MPLALPLAKDPQQSKFEPEQKEKIESIDLDLYNQENFGVLGTVIVEIEHNLFSYAVAM